MRKFPRLALILAAALVCAACTPAIGERNEAGVMSYGPDKHGVICYAVFKGSPNLSCVKVQP